MPKISQLQPAPILPLVGNEPFVVVQNGVTVKAPVDQIPINLSYPTIAALEAASPPAAEDSVYVEGYYVSGDGGGHWRKRGIGAGQVVDNQGDTWIVSDIALNVLMFGATRNGITDDFQAIRNSIDFASEQGGAYPFVPPGEYALKSQIMIEESFIGLIGAGYGVHRTVTEPLYAAKFIWAGVAGSGPMILIEPRTGSARLDSIKFCGIMLEGNSVADACLHARSIVNSELDFQAQESTGDCVLFGCIPGSLTTARDFQHCSIKVWVKMVSNSGDGVVIESTTGANFSINIDCWIFVNHSNGDGFVLNAADNNNFFDVQCRRIGGTGRGVVLNGSLSIGDSHCRANRFLRVDPGDGLFYSMGTADFAQPAVNNIIDFYDWENNANAPVIGADSTLFYRTNYIVSFNGGYAKSGFGVDTPTTRVATADAIASNATIAVINDANSGIVLGTSSLSTRWVQAINSGSGSIDFIATSATGSAGVNTTRHWMVDGVKVVGNQETGWTVPTGTIQRTGYATYTSPTISNPPTQSEVQAIADALEDVSRTLAALITDLDAAAGHGLIGT